MTQKESGPTETIVDGDEVAVAVGRLYAALQRVAALDDLFRESRPRVSLGPSILADVETALGQRLPATLRAYYSKFDQWDGFWLDKCVLSVRALVEGPDWQISSERFGWVESVDLAREGLERSDWWVIGLDRHGVDLYLAHRETGEVVWWAGEVVERFTSLSGLLQRYASSLEEYAGELAARGH